MLSIIRNILFLLALFTLCNSCYSFKGISIPVEINTFNVANFENIAIESPADLEVKFSEALRTKIRNESRLKYNNNAPDIEFSGELTIFKISSESPAEGNTVALGRLDIGVNIRYKNNLNEKDAWVRSYSYFKTYDSNADFNSIQDELVKEIFAYLTENIFNDSFTNW